MDFFLLFILFTSCNQPNFYRESLLKELQETDADSGLLILLKDNEIAAKVNLIKEDSIYKDGNEEVFHQPRNTQTLITPIPFMCILDSISPTDTVDVGNGIQNTHQRNCRKQRTCISGLMKDFFITIFIHSIFLNKIYFYCNFLIL